MPARQVDEVPRLLTRFRAYEEQCEHAKLVVEHVTAQRKVIGRYSPSDALTLRGIPVVGPLPDLGGARREHYRETHRAD